MDIWKAWRHVPLYLSGHAKINQPRRRPPPPSPPSASSSSPPKKREERESEIERERENPPVRKSPVPFSPRRLVRPSPRSSSSPRSDRRWRWRWRWPIWAIRHRGFVGWLAWFFFIFWGVFLGGGGYWEIGMGVVGSVIVVVVVDDRGCLLAIWLCVRRLTLWLSILLWFDCFQICCDLIWF